MSDTVPPNHRSDRRRHLPQPDERCTGPLRAEIRDGTWGVGIWHSPVMVPLSEELIGPGFKRWFSCARV